MNPRPSSARSWLTGGIIFALCVVNILLVKQNFGLRGQLAALTQNKVDAAANSLKRGDVVPPVSGLDLAGRPYQLDYKEDKRRQMLLFISPSCAYCVQQALLWRDLLDTVDTTRVNVVGVVGDREDSRAVTAHAEELGYFKTKVALPILIFDQESLTRYKLTATPTTLLISANGTVEHAWVGKWDQSKTSEVAMALK